MLMTTSQSRCLRAGVAGRTTEARRSIEEQNADNRRRASARDGRLPARSRTRTARLPGSPRARPAYKEMLAAIRDDELDVVVLWESSRGGRELEAWAGFLNACRKHRVKIHMTSHSRTYDMTVGRDWRSLAEDGVDSGYECEKTCERALRAGRPVPRTAVRTG